MRWGGELCVSGVWWQVEVLAGGKHGVCVNWWCSRSCCQPVVTAGGHRVQRCLKPSAWTIPSANNPKMLTVMFRTPQPLLEVWSCLRSKAIACRGGYFPPAGPIRHWSVDGAATNWAKNRAVSLVPPSSDLYKCIRICSSWGSLWVAVPHSRGTARVLSQVGQDLGTISGRDGCVDRSICRWGRAGKLDIFAWILGKLKINNWMLC